MAKKRPASETALDEPVRKKRKTPVKRKPSPLAKFRAQTLLRKRELLKIIKETNKELRLITRDLGVLKKSPKEK